MQKSYLPKASLELLAHKHSILTSHNSRFLSLLIKATQLCAPLSDGLNVLYSFDDAGADLNFNIYNAKPKLLNNLRANQLHKLLCPPNEQWARINEIDHTTKKLIPNSAEAQKITQTIFNKFGDSNLHDVLKSFFIDFNLGTAALWAEYIDKKLFFVPISGITILPDLPSRHRSNAFWRRVLSKEEFRMLYPKVIKEKAQEFYYVDYAYFYINDRYYYVQALEGNFTEPLSIEEDGCNHLILVNDTQRPGEGRGRGIILNTLEDIIRLNSISKPVTNYIEYKAEPLTLSDINIPDNLYDLKGKIISCNMPIDKKPQVEPIIWNLELRDVHAFINDLETRLEQYFNVLPFGEINQTPVRTATEVAARQAEAQNQTLADLSRLADKFLGGLLDTMYRILVKSGEIKPLPSHGYEFTSIQATLQSEQDLSRLLRYGEVAQQLGGQMAIPMFNNPVKMDKELKRLFNVPSEISNSPEEMQAFIKGFQQSQQQAPGQPTPVSNQQPVAPQNPSRMRVLGV